MLDQGLRGEFDITHIAYDESEYAILANSYGVQPERIVRFKDSLRALLSKKDCYDPDRISEIDKLIIENTNGRFSLNSSIQSDRALALKSYEEAILLAEACFDFWEATLSDLRPDYIFHEMTSLLINHSCSVVAKSLSVIYASEIQVLGPYDYNLLFCTYSGGTPLQIQTMLKSSYSIPDEERSLYDAFLQNFRANCDTILMMDKFKNPNGLSLLLPSLRVGLSSFLKRKSFPELCDYIERFMYYENPPAQKMRNLHDYRKIKWDDYDPQKRFYYYPLHLEPEAAVLYWGDGLYKNQIKLIENIAAMLPPGAYLYVKDHPHEIGYRSVADYLQLQEIPNVKLLYATVPGKRLIKDAEAVITINGTAGFEAVLMNKPVYAFGNPFYEYSKRVHKIRNIKDFREAVYQAGTEKFSDDEEMYKFLHCFFHNVYPGNTACYYGPTTSLDSGNERNVMKSFSEFIKSARES
jgi:Capsule polysaccharide export protein